MDITEVLDHLSKHIGVKEETLGREPGWIKITHVSNKGVKYKHKTKKGEEEQRPFSKDKIERYWKYLIENGRLSKDENPSPTSAFSYLPAILSLVPGVEIKVETSPKTGREIVVLYWRGYSK